MIGKLQYVVHSTLEIALVVGIVARFFANPRANHLTTVKIIMRYLKGTYDFGLYYKRSENFELNAYTDEYLEGNTIGGSLFLERRLVTWTSKKKSYTS